FMTISIFASPSSEPPPVRAPLGTGRAFGYDNRAMPTRKPYRPVALALLAALLLAVPASAYIVVMKDGSTITAAEAYEVRGDKAIITLPSGAVTQIDLDEIDQEETKQVNARGYGDAELVDDGTT